MKTRLSVLMVLALLVAVPAIAGAQTEGPVVAGIVEASSARTCALRPTGALDCWGNNASNLATDRPGPYTQISAGPYHHCALTPSGAADCWGENTWGQAEDQPGPYTWVSVGHAHSCALTPSGAVDCWGRNPYGEAVDQPGPYTQLSTGGMHTCALRPSGAVDCWGYNSYGQANDRPGPYIQVSAGDYHTCALTPSGAVDCWGGNYNGEGTGQPGPYTQVSTGWSHNCGLTPSGAVDCWGYNAYGQANDEAGPYTQVSAGTYHTCALTPAGAVHCWGNNPSGEAEDYPGPYGPYDPNANPNSPPVANPGGPYLGAINSSIAFDGSSSSDLNGDPLTYAWTFGDGGTATDQMPVHSYAAAGVYDVCLTVNDGQVDSAPDCTTAVVNTPPVAIPGGPYLGPVNTAIQFDGSGSSDADGDPLTYAWTFGDGGTATAQMPAHSYAAAGVYDVCLTVNDGTADSEPACTMAVVYDPTGGFVTGGGWIDSPPGAYKPDPSLSGPATFGFVSRYQKGSQVPSGHTSFQFDAAGFGFDSGAYEWLVVNQAGTNAQFKGSGMVNGALDPNGNPYKFMIWATDATSGGSDTLRIRIWWEAGGVETDVYDNGTDQAIGAGNIVVHTSK